MGLLLAAACSTPPSPPPPSDAAVVPADADVGAADASADAAVVSAGALCGGGCAGAQVCAARDPGCGSGYCLFDGRTMRSDSYCTGSCADLPCPPGYGCQQLEAPSGRFCVALPAVCGDGVVQRGEACDDRNTAPRDGCSSDCARVEYAPGSATFVGTLTRGADAGVIRFNINRCEIPSAGCDVGAGISMSGESIDVGVQGRLEAIFEDVYLSAAVPRMAGTYEATQRFSNRAHVEVQSNRFGTYSPDARRGATVTTTVTEVSADRLAVRGTLRGRLVRRDGSDTDPALTLDARFDVTLPPPH